MSDEIPQANPPLSAAEQGVVDALTEQDLAIIDAAILGECTTHWYKVARVAGRTEDALAARYPGLSVIFYAQRLIQLAEEGRLESQGNLKWMRFSEVRLPA
jgi:hypothetical protein